MEIVRIDPLEPDPAVVRRAAEVLRGGGLVAFPTETVYGVGANALDAVAVRRIFEAKGRPSFNPLIAHVPDVERAMRLTTSWPDSAARLAERFWPGPLTLVLPRAPEVPDEVTAGRGTVALRVPAHAVARALLQSAGIPLAAPSANRYTEVSATTAAHVVKGLAGRVDLVLDGGPTSVGIESTVVDLSGDQPLLLRPGSIALSDLREVVGPLPRAAEMEDETARPSPGMVRRHYSPRARLRVFQRSDRSAMAEAARAAVERGARVGALLLEPLNAPVQHAMQLPADPEPYARLLYSALHELDDAGCDLILVDAVPEGGEWLGVRDRLSRAAHQD